MGGPPSRDQSPTSADGSGAFVLTLRRESARGLDRAAQDEFAVPGVILMENAAVALCAECLDALDAAAREDPLVVLCCGRGNNGGDGLALARHLHNAGVRVVALLVGAPDDYAGDSAINMRIVQRMRLPVATLDAEAPAQSLDELSRRFGEPTLVVDALLGTGMDQPVRRPISDVVAWINAQGARGATIIAADIPTGLDCDSGLPLLPPGASRADTPPLDAVVRADVTVTFAGVKVGFLNAAAHPFVGEVVVGDIGAPSELLERFGERVNIEMD